MRTTKSKQRASYPVSATMRSRKPAFGPDITKAHMNAILKRSVFVVNTDTHIHYRKAGIKQDRVRRIEIPNAECLTDAGKAFVRDVQKWRSSAASRLQRTDASGARVGVLALFPMLAWQASPRRGPARQPPHRPFAMCLSPIS